MSTKWASEKEAILALGLGDFDTFDHCESCHSEMEYGYYPAVEVELPDGRWAEVCCRVSLAIRSREAR